MSAAPTRVLAPVTGRAADLAEVPDPTFAQAVVGPGVAIMPPQAVVDVVSPIGGRLLKVFPHAFVVLAPDGVGVLVHLGIDTVELAGAGFVLRAEQGSTVEAGDVVVRYDVPAITAGGRNPIVPVIVLEQKAENLAVAVAAGTDITLGDLLLTVQR